MLIMTQSNWSGINRQYNWFSCLQLLSNFLHFTKKCISYSYIEAVLGAFFSLSFVHIINTRNPNTHKIIDKYISNLQYFLSLATIMLRIRECGKSLSISNFSLCIMYSIKTIQLNTQQKIEYSI